MLITGAAGFIGQNLMKKTDGVPLDVKYGDDVTSRESLAALYRSGPIIHLAAQSGVPQSVEDPEPSFYSNTLGTYCVLNFAREKEARIILASSAAADNITSPYAASKACGEAYAKAYHHSYGLSYAALRFANVYGPLSDKKTSCIPQMVKSAVYNNEIIIYGDGNQKRDFIYVDDVCEAILDFTITKEVGIFDVGTGVKHSVNQVAEIISGLTRAPIKYAKGREGEVLDPAPTLAFMKECVQLEDGIIKTLEYFT